MVSAVTRDALVAAPRERRPPQPPPMTTQHRRPIQNHFLRNTILRSLHAARSIDRRPTTAATPNIDDQQPPRNSAAPAAGRGREPEGQQPHPPQPEHIDRAEQARRPRAVVEQPAGRRRGWSDWSATPARNAAASRRAAAAPAPRGMHRDRQRRRRHDRRRAVDPRQHHQRQRHQQRDRRRQQQPAAAREIHQQRRICLQPRRTPRRPRGRPSASIDAHALVDERLPADVGVEKQPRRRRATASRTTTQVVMKAGCRTTSAMVARGCTQHTRDTRRIKRFPLLTNTTHRRALVSLTVFQTAEYDGLSASHACRDSRRFRHFKNNISCRQKTATAAVAAFWRSPYPCPCLLRLRSTGTRAAGMAGAFVAVADDATAVYWNPAGVATGSYRQRCAGLRPGSRRTAPVQTATPGGSEDTAALRGASATAIRAWPTTGWVLRPRQPPEPCRTGASEPRRSAAQCAGLTTSTCRRDRWCSRSATTSSSGHGEVRQRRSHERRQSDGRPVRRARRAARSRERSTRG